MRRNITILLMVTFFTFGCIKKQPEVNTEKPVQHNLAMATLYNHFAQEYTALAYQAFNIAKIKIDRVVTEKKNRKPAVIVDIDETVLDNSPYEALTIVTKKDYPVNWNEWCNFAGARAVPGAVEFLNYAVSKGVNLFYVSNRKKAFVEEGTVENLKKLGFPQVEDKHIMLREDGNDKQERRDKITDAGYEIVLLIGDNLGDFYSDSGNNEERNAEVEAAKDKFGDEYIVLPNAIYGNWPSAIGADTQQGIDSLLNLMVADFLDSQK